MGIYLSVDISSVNVVALVTEIAGEAAIVQSKVISQMSFEDLTAPALHSVNAEGGQMIAASESDQIRTFINRHEKIAQKQILIVNPAQLISLTFNTPFDDEKLLADIISQEIRDRVPFEIDNFIIVHRVVRKVEDGDFEIQVSLLRQEYHARVLEFCRLVSFEPNLITVPAAVLNTVGSATGDTVYLSRAGNILNAACQIGGVLCSAGNVPCDDQYRELQMLMLDWEARYQTSFSTGYLIGNGVDLSELEKGVSLKIEQIKIPEAEGVEHAYLGSLAASRSENTFIVNFKSSRKLLGIASEFATEFFKKTWLLWVFIFLLAMAIPAGMIGLTSFETSRINESVKQEISSIIPALKLSSESGIDELLAFNGSMESQLSTLGTPTKFDPLSVYVILSAELKEALDPKIGMTLNEIEIKGADVTIDGLVSSYRSVESIEKIFTKRGDVFCKVKKETLGDSGANKRFKFRITLC